MVAQKVFPGASYFSARTCVITNLCITKLIPFYIIAHISCLVKAFWCGLWEPIDDYWRLFVSSFLEWFLYISIIQTNHERNKMERVFYKCDILLFILIHDLYIKENMTCIIPPRLTNLTDHLQVQKVNGESKCWNNKALQLIRALLSAISCVSLSTKWI